MASAARRAARLFSLYRLSARRRNFVHDSALPPGTLLGMPVPLPFSAAGRLPAAGDNVAIAIRQLDAGTAIEIDGEVQTVTQTILEGHRFAVQDIAVGAPLLSWGLPFGHATIPIKAGDYICNRSILEALAVRRLPFSLPAQPNFADHLVPFTFDEAAF